VRFSSFVFFFSSEGQKKQSVSERIAGAARDAESTAKEGLGGMQKEQWMGERVKDEEECSESEYKRGESQGGGEERMGSYLDRKKNEQRNEC